MMLALSPLPVPALLSRRLDAYAQTLSQSKGMHFDFARPVGEPALIAANSVAWQIFKNPLTLHIGGISAVILELAEPQVRDGLWQSPTFRTDAPERLKALALAKMIAVYGAKSAAERMIDGTDQGISRKSAVLPKGRAHLADDPILLDWVQAASSFSAIEAYHRYVRPLTDADRNAFLAEGQCVAQLYGAKSAAASLDDLDLLFDVMRNRLVKSAVIHDFLDTMQHVRSLPAPLRPLRGIFVKAAIDVLPPWVRDRLDLWSHWSLSSTERRIINTLARAADRLLLPSSAPVQACKRLGLPASYLYGKGNPEDANPCPTPQALR